MYHVGEYNIVHTDTAGQEEFCVVVLMNFHRVCLLLFECDRFNVMRDGYYRTGDGFVLVYSITSQNSFEDMKKQYEHLIRSRGCVNENDKPPPVVLAGNKCDLDHLREVSTETGMALGMLFAFAKSQIYTISVSI